MEMKESAKTSEVITWEDFVILVKVAMKLREERDQLEKENFRLLEELAELYQEISEEVEIEVFG